MGIILLTILGIILILSIDFLLSAGLVWIVCWAFGWTFTWPIAIGVYAITILIHGVFRVTVHNINND